MVAFGLKYRSSLSAFHRSVMGDAAIPTALGLLLIGITSQGVDNWAHGGGLVAGLITGSFMRPRLLAEGAPLRIVETQVRELSRGGYLRGALVSVAGHQRLRPRPDLLLLLAHELCDALAPDLGCELARAVLGLPATAASRWVPGGPYVAANLLLGDALLAAVYPEMRRLARHLLVGDRMRQQIEPTELVHGAALKLIGQAQLSAHDRGHFLAYAGQVMRQVLIDSPLDETVTLEIATRLYLMGVVVPVIGVCVVVGCGRMRSAGSFWIGMAGNVCTAGPGTSSRSITSCRSLVAALVRLTTLRCFVAPAIGPRALPSR